MADVKQIIKQMQEQGMTREEIKASLEELGFENADELSKTVLGEEEPAAKPSTPTAPTPSMEEEEAPPKELFEAFEKEKPAKPLKPSKPAEAAEERGKPAAKEEKEAREEELLFPSELKITSVSEEGEKEVSIQEMLAKALPEETKGGGEALAGRLEVGSLKAKLDEAIALLKALQEINKKILEADREVLMRLKKS